MGGGNITPHKIGGDVWCHVFRELNKEADKLATRAFLLGNRYEMGPWGYKTPTTIAAIRGCCDGGSRANVAGAGWWLEAAV